MGFIHKFIGSTVPSFDPPKGWSKQRIQLFDSMGTQNVNSYLHLLDYFYCSTDYAVLGPEDWYLSKAEVYKDKRGLRYECLVATLRLTPDRLPNPPLRVPVVASLPRLKVSTSFGAHPVKDKPFISIQPKRPKYKLLGCIEFPAPPIRLPHEKASDAVFEALSAPGGSDEIQGSSSHTPCIAFPAPFISLFTLINLADSVGRYPDPYTLIKNSRFGYCSMIFFCLQMYTSSDIIVHTSGDNRDLIIKSNDSAKTIAKMFKDAKLNRRRYSVLKVLKISKDEEVARVVLAKWKPYRERMDNKIRTWRLSRIGAQRKRIEDARKRARENLRARRLKDE